MYYLCINGYLGVIWWIYMDLMVDGELYFFRKYDWLWFKVYK